MLGVVQQKVRFSITSHKVKTIYRPAIILSFILISSLCDASYFLTETQKNSARRCSYKKNYVEILLENRTALEVYLRLFGCTGIKLLGGNCVTYKYG